MEEFVPPVDDHAQSGPRYLSICPANGIAGYGAGNQYGNSTIGGPKHASNGVVMSDAIDETAARDEEENTFDVYNREVIEEAEKNAIRLKQKKLRVVEAIMSNEDGRAWMFDLLGGNCHVFSENSLNGTIEKNAKFEGERAVGLRVLDEVMTAAPEMFWKMRCEAVERDKRVFTSKQA